MARLVKMTKLEKTLALTGYKLVMDEKPKAHAKKAMTKKHRRAIGKGVRAAVAAKSNGAHATK